MKVVHIKNAAKAVKRVVVAKARGEAVIMDAASIAQREAACAQCPFKKGDKCAKCGCYLPLKQQLTTESCPIHRWPITNA